MWVEERGTCPVCKLKDLAASSLSMEPPPPPPDASDTEVRRCESSGDYDGQSISTGTGTGTSASSYVSVATLAWVKAWIEASCVNTVPDCCPCSWRSNRPSGDRIVVFSSWTRLLRVAADALRASGIPCASLVGSATDKQEALRRFGALQEDDCMQVEGSGTGSGGR